MFIKLFNNSQTGNSQGAQKPMNKENFIRMYIIMEYYLAIKKNETRSLAGKWMEL
jgi:hypothetical protein